MSSFDFTIHMIIAHYDKDVSWISNLTLPKGNIFIYQKRNPAGTLYLPNRGNECLAYVRHIVDHYYRLADYSVFLHDNPLQHCKNFMEYLQSLPIFASHLDYVAGKPRPLVFITDKYLNNSQTILKEYIPDVFEYHVKWVGTPIPSHGTSIWCNGQFQVSKELIRRKPLEFWQDLLVDLLDSDSIHGDEHGVFICGYLEQMWHELFGYPAVTDIHSPLFNDGQQGVMCNRNSRDPI